MSMMTSPREASASTISTSSSSLLPWAQNPINKRYGTKVQDAETVYGYNIGFVTYLTRFLLNFDKNLQQYWITNIATTPAEEVFGELAASVEVKLLDYKGPQGANRLLQELIDRYCPVTTMINESETTTNTTISKRTRRERKEARRQLALLFALLQDKDLQPVAAITQLLGQIDNARIRDTEIRFTSDNNNIPFPNPFLPVYDPTTNNTTSSSTIIFTPPVIGNVRAQGVPIWSPPEIVDIRMTNGGAGYTTTAGDANTTTPTVAINGIALNSSLTKLTIQNGKITRIQLTSPQKIPPWSNTPPTEQFVPPEITISPPPSASSNSSPGKTATAVAVVQQRIVGVNVTNPGAGYVLEKPIQMYYGPSQYSNATTEQLTQLVQSNKILFLGNATGVSETSSYSSFQSSTSTKDATTTTTTTSDEEGGTGTTKPISAASSGPDDGLPALPFWNPSSSSATFLRLFPAGVGVEYDVNVKRYFIVVDQSIRLQNPNIRRRPLGPEFGPRGRAPVERDRELTLDTLIRFSLSGAICASGVHVALTPLDVVKTKVQTNPDRYPTVLTSFSKVFQDEGLSTFFSGWAPTLAGNFVSGAAVYTLTEFIRRSLSEQVGPSLAVTYEVPIILFAAAVAASTGSVLICPFEAVRIRQVAQPTFAPNAVAVLNRLLQEEGWISLAKSIPVFLIKNVPYAMTKFTIFDLSTERMYAAFPQATENLKLSLLVSLLGGCFGGTAAAVVSNPADALLSELKKAKSDIAPWDAATAMWERGKFRPFWKGLPVRLVYYSLIASFQFLVYDGVRFALGIGSDDLKLYLDVLGGALQETGGPL
jgi:solute carrier family 25 phosphate transporter 3